MTSPWLWMICTALLRLLTLVTSATSLCVPRLRDTKIQYDNTIPSSNSAISDPCLKDAPLLTWKKYWDKYIDACLTLDGRGWHDGCCTGSKCQSPNPTFRCCDCFGLALYCKACIIDHCCNEPLHFLEVLLPQPYEYSGIVINWTNVNIGMEEWLFSEDYIPKLGITFPTRSQTWDLMSLPNSGPQRFRCSSCQWHPCAQYQLLWLWWHSAGLWTAFRGRLVAINASGTPISCLYGGSSVVSYLKSPRPDFPDRFLLRPRTNDVWWWIIICTSKHGCFLVSSAWLTCWCFPRIISPSGCLWSVNSTISR